MNEREKMIQILYKAASDGVAKLIRNGLAFTVMTMVIAGLVWGLLTMHDLHGLEMTALKSECRQMKEEHAVQLNDLRREIAACIAERMKDGARIARLEALIENKKR